MGVLCFAYGMLLGDAPLIVANGVPLVLAVRDTATLCHQEIVRP